MTGKTSIDAMIAEKYAILYVTSATVCECVSQWKALQDKPSAVVVIVVVSSQPFRI